MFAKDNGVTLDRRFSATVQARYLANICTECDQIQGNWFLYMDPYHDRFNLHLAERQVYGPCDRCAERYCLTHAEYLDYDGHRQCPTGLTGNASIPIGARKADAISLTGKSGRGKSRGSTRKRSEGNWKWSSRRKRKNDRWTGKPRNNGHRNGRSFRNGSPNGGRNPCNTENQMKTRRNSAGTKLWRRLWPSIKHTGNWKRNSVNGLMPKTRLTRSEGPPTPSPG